ncbi:ATP-binding protein [Ammoniphilus sp. CFH 90114]|uniref:ATP-binding protein n=1 Tax=Ammoniphilus sp. CFH 90114 TaxID=2493665 RepID=UPI00100EFBA2|nr:ATP-binding protein [Ammoniphilus sp. CFH 90114]RXT04541.1 hypothetical protein EIZ39_20210 [Ammoniphilus sp. CFH 90114]
MNEYYIKFRNENDIYLILHNVRLLMQQLRFTEMEQQKVVVAVSELTRNVLDHAQSAGSFSCELIGEKGIQFIIQDQGKGIDHLDDILNGKGSPNRRGLGLGLTGAKRMMDEFTIETSKEGTKVVCIKWKSK